MISRNTAHEKKVSSTMRWAVCIWVKEGKNEGRKGMKGAKRKERSDGRKEDRKEGRMKEMMQERKEGKEGRWQTREQAKMKGKREVKF